nr:hypothetical protein [Tanacetum cinerariifolium]
LKDRVLVLEDRESVAAKQSGDDAPIKGRSINEGEVAAEWISNDLEEIARVLTSMDAATVLAGGIDVPTSSVSIPTTESTEKANDQEAEEGLLHGYDQKQLRVEGKRFQSMTFEEIKAKFVAVWKQVEDFIPMGSKEEAERLKRKGLN